MADHLLGLLGAHPSGTGGELLAGEIGQAEAALGDGDIKLCFRCHFGTLDAEDIGGDLQRHALVETLGGNPHFPHVAGVAGYGLLSDFMSPHLLEHLFAHSGDILVGGCDHQCHAGDVHLHDVLAVEVNLCRFGADHQGHVVLFVHFFIAEDVHFRDGDLFAQLPKAILVEDQPFFPFELLCGAHDVAATPDGIGDFAALDEVFLVGLPSAVER